VSFNQGEVEGGDGIVAEINVTPLTDIFLVLLIIFMVTSTALIQQGTPVNLPKAAAGVATPSGLVITATADRQIELDGKRIPLEGLGAGLRAAFRARSDRNVILQGDRTVILEDAVKILSIAKEAGAEKIAIATELEREARP
jgi:biopolymer transport protein ExbD